MSKSDAKITITRKGKRMPKPFKGLDRYAEVRCGVCGLTTRWLPTRSDSQLRNIAKHHRDVSCKGST